MDTSNTGENRSYRGRFRKNDPRINRKGRPKSFGALRKEAQKIACEIVAIYDKAGDVSAEISRIDIILLDWATSKDPRKQRLFVEYAYGKVPDSSEITGEDGGPIKIEAVDYRMAIASLAPLEAGSMADRHASGED